MFAPQHKKGKSTLRWHPWHIPQFSCGTISSTMSNTTTDKMTYYFKQRCPTEMRASRICGPSLTIHKCHMLNVHSFTATCQRFLLFALTPHSMKFPSKLSIVHWLIVDANRVINLLWLYQSMGLEIQRCKMNWVIWSFEPFLWFFFLSCKVFWICVHPKTSTPRITCCCH